MCWYIPTHTQLSLWLFNYPLQQRQKSLRVHSPFIYIYRYTQRQVRCEIHTRARQDEDPPSVCYIRNSFYYTHYYYAFSVPPLAAGCARARVHTAGMKGADLPFCSSSPIVYSMRSAVVSRVVYPLSLSLLLGFFFFFFILNFSRGFLSAQWTLCVLCVCVYERENAE